MFRRKPKANRMCKSKSATATTAPSSSSMAAAAAAQRNHRSPRTTTTSSTFPASFSYSASSSTASSSATSLAALRDSLPELPLLFTYHDLAAATGNFSSSHRLVPASTSSNSNSYRCSLRGHPAAVFRRPLHRDARDVSARLAVLGHCHHAAIARLLGAAASPDRTTLFLAYELVPDAAPLSALLRNPKNPSFTPLASWHCRLKVAADVCDALHYVHRQAGTVHNRLSASSVLVCGDGHGALLRAKIAHFGAADLAGDLPDEDDAAKGSGHRRAGSRGRRIEGTRGYMAPELVAGGPPSRRADVFALGVLLLELLSGNEPVRYELRANGEFERTSLIEAAEAAAADGGGEAMRRWVDRRLKDSFPVDAAESLTALALRCVAKDPAARPDMSWVAAKVSKLFLDAQDWDAKFRMPTDISISIAPR